MRGIPDRSIYDPSGRTWLRLFLFCGDPVEIASSHPPLNLALCVSGIEISIHPKCTYTHFWMGVTN
jgi:hypothetical protein